MVIVVLPSAVAAAYYGLVASDAFISESRFIVRSPQRSTPSGLGALLQGTVFSRSQDDTHAVHDYIRSRDALREVEGQLHFKALFSHEQVDRLSRFPGLSLDDSFEALHRYYMKQVVVDFDTTSSISVLRVRAFNPEDARAINDLLLSLGERLVNNLNNRSRQDLIKTAELEVKAAEDRAKSAAQALSGFRKDGNVYDPDRQSALQLQAVGKLQEELMGVELQTRQLRQVAPNNPQLPLLESRAKVLRQSIEDESAKVTGRGGSLAGKAPAYDRLALEKLFADRQLTTALASLESARSEAQRKHLYLERLVQPNLPDMSVEPRRLRSFLSVLAASLIAWALVVLVIAAVREHAD
jgi:capsular polysaccharide transport system permease protein